MTASVTLLIRSGLTSTAYIYGIHLAQVCLHFAHGHAACIQGDDLVAKAGETAFVLADELRFEGTMPVTRHVDAPRPSSVNTALALLPLR